MHDLGILDTDFARVVLGVAVLEDIVLYVVLAIAVGYAGGTAGNLFGLPEEVYSVEQAVLTYVDRPFNESQIRRGVFNWHRLEPDT